MIKRALTSLLFLVLLPACTPLGMIYAHRDTYGLDMTTGANSTAPFQLNLGASNHMATYVPVGIPEGNYPVGSSAGQIASAFAKAANPQDAKAVMASLRDFPELADMFSVYSTFSSKTDAKAGALVLNRGNMFATGIAARRLAEADQARICLELEKLAEENKTDADKSAAIRNTITAVCPVPAPQ